MLKASPKKFKNEEVKGIISGTFASAMGNKVKKKKEQYRRKSITIIYQDPCSQCQLKKNRGKKTKTNKSPSDRRLWFCGRLEENRGPPLSLFFLLLFTNISRSYRKP